MARKSTPDNITLYELNIDEHVPYVNPADYNISDFAVPKPTDYFVTSGDAVVKAEHLNRDMWQCAGEARKRFKSSSTKRHLEFQQKLWECAGKCRTMLGLLKKIRGTHIFLEVEWRDHVVCCIPKDPRKKDIID